MRAGIVGAVALLCACATTTSAIHPDDEAKPGFAYLYGRFFIRADEQEGSFVGHQSIALRLWCRNQQEYTIWFSPKRDVQVLQVYPSLCALVSGVFTDQNGMVRGHMKIEAADLLYHKFEAGQAYYLGDYFARGIFELTMYSTYNEAFWSWAMDPADGRYDATTLEMKRMFRNLAALPTKESQLIEPKPAPKRGAVVITDPKEPPMTPERIARVAPFIKRTFASPAACEAACRTGQCLPFRGENGPAMTCVIRCNTDKDCPGGLACNCPNADKPDGPDCKPIATTPADRMARICLPVERAGPEQPAPARI